MGNYKITLAILAMAFVVSSCSSLRHTTKSVKPYNPTFTNDLPQHTRTNNKSDIDVVIAMIKPSYPYKRSYSLRAFGVATSSDVYKYMLAISNIGNQFQQAIASGLTETINKRGFLIKGPYESYNRMVYSDRRNSDLILKTKIDIYPVVTNKNIGSTLYPRYYYIKKGTARIGGRITLTILEPMTQIKLWTRSIPIPDQTFSFVGTQNYARPPSVVLLKKETSFRNGVAKALEGVYDELLDTIYRYLNPREMQKLKKQGIEIKKDSDVG